MESRNTEIPAELLAVGAALERLGWPTELFYDGEAEPGLRVMHFREDLPDTIWLKALERAGQPHPCLGCMQSGDGYDCMQGNCRHASPLILPPSATWKGGFRG
jgi:hypothetical protein